MSVLRDSHVGIVPATVVYVYTSNAICSLCINSCYSSRVTKVKVTLNHNLSSNKSTHLSWRTKKLC